MTIHSCHNVKNLFMRIAQALPGADGGHADNATTQRT
jgi:hypothetical protein